MGIQDMYYTCKIYNNMYIYSIVDVYIIWASV